MENGLNMITYASHQEKDTKTKDTNLSGECASPFPPAAVGSGHGYRALTLQHLL